MCEQFCFPIIEKLKQKNTEIISFNTWSVFIQILYVPTTADYMAFLSRGYSHN